MPLIKGKSQKSFVKNLKAELESGKPQKQSLAIAYAMKRKAKKMSKGGKVHGVHEEEGHGYSKAGAHASFAKELADKNDPDYKNSIQKHNDEAVYLHKEKLKELKDMPKPKLQGLSKGGSVKGVNTSDYDMPAKQIKNKFEKHNMGESKAGEHTRMAMENKGFKGSMAREEAIDSHHKVLGQLSQLKPKLQGLASGGRVMYAGGSGQVGDESFNKSLKTSFKTPEQAPKQASNTEVKASPSPAPASSSSSNWSESDRTKAAADRNKSLYGTYALGGEVYEPAHLMDQIHVDKHEDMLTGEGYYLRPTQYDKSRIAHNEPAMHEDNMKYNQHMVDMNASTDMDEESLVDRIMKKKNQDFSSEARFSKGGQVANQDHGDNNNEMAGFSPNEFDDLVLRDELESSYGDDNNSGDSLGNKQEDMDRADIISRIMRSQKKKDRMPNPA